ncbi:MAG: hypothetical protein KatS3mg042_0832 [Rhodothermaceae bacterium]|nr:MAG: hypothetical protein KatS3mg042_0832 [Rhodothermaceae bacterium]
MHSPSLLHTAPSLCPPVLRASGATHPGRLRTRNEDRFVCAPEHGLFMVIDGVGGHRGGDVAADLAREVVCRHLLEHRIDEPDDVRLYRALIAASRAIHRQSRSNPEYLGMACVLTVVLVHNGHATVGHVGDTRLYVIRPDEITKITRDHSVVGIREDRGELDEWEAMLHPRRNEILRDLGSAWHDPGDEEFIDLYRFPFDPETALLLCTDGLTDLVPSDVLHRTTLEHAGHPERSVEALIELANRAGGYDNITVVLAEGSRFAAPSTPARETPCPPPEATSGPAPLPPFWPAVGTLLLVVLLWWFWITRGSTPPPSTMLPP